MNWRRLFRRGPGADNRFSGSEMIIGLAIVAIIVGLVIIQFNNHQARGRDSQRRQDISAIQQKVDLYYAIHSYYPANLQQLNDLSEPVCRDPRGHGTCKKPDYGYRAFGPGQAVLPTAQTNCDNSKTICSNYILYSTRMEKADNPYFVRSY